MKRLLIFTLIALYAITSCGKIHTEDNTRGLIKISAQASISGDTKTSISGRSLSWVMGDKFGVYVDGIQTNIPFVFGGDDSFVGYFSITGEYRPNAQFRAYYPIAPYNETSVVSTNLPAVQSAPFDPSADYVLSQITTAEYNEAAMPLLNFTFDNHFFAFVKVTVRNTDPLLENEPIVGIKLESEGDVLSGKFQFDILDDTPTPIFSTSSSDVFNSVSLVYPEKKSVDLGLNVDHVFYAVINPVTTNNLKLTINTLKYTKTFESKVELTFNRGCVTSLPDVVLTKDSMKKRYKILVYWGDSIGPKILTDNLQSLLGPGWKVIRCAIGGDDAWEIAGRQGGIPMCLKSHYVIPGNSSEKIEVSGIYSTWDSYGNYNPSQGRKLNKYTWFDEVTYGVHLNPCEIQGVKCNFTYDPETEKIYLQRVTDGDPVDVPAYSIVHSYASLYYRDADVSAIYMGTNLRVACSDELLAKQYRAMIDFALNKKYIVEGFHWRDIGRGYLGWTQEFSTTFTETFGANFIDLRCYGNANANRLLIESGRYNDLSEMSDLDKSVIPLGDWPASWTDGYETNPHPNSYGHKALAIMIYEKMRDLGYLDE